MSDPPALPFAEAAPYYRKYRAPYAREAIPYVCEAFGLGASARALDLGCGPGAVALPLSGLIGAVVAVDQDETMLAEGRKAAAAAGRANIEWRCARAEAFADAPDSYDVVTMGQSFHWMDRDLVLRRLAPMIRRGGGIALIAPSARTQSETWEPLVLAVVRRYLGPQQRHPAKNPEPHNIPSLTRSEAFARFHARSFVVEFERDVAAVVAHVYSMSHSPPSRFGERRGAFERELSAELLRAYPAGVWRERLETEVVIAPKRHA